MAKLSRLTRQAPRWSQIRPQAAFLTIIMGKLLVFTTMWKESFWSLGLVVEMYISRSVLKGYATVWWTRGRISAALSVIGYSCMHSSAFHPNLSAYWRSGVAMRRARSKYGPYQKENVWHQLSIQFHNNSKSRQCTIGERGMVVKQMKPGTGLCESKMVALLHKQNTTVIAFVDMTSKKTVQCNLSGKFCLCTNWTNISVDI